MRRVYVGLSGLTRDKLSLCNYLHHIAKADVRCDVVNPSEVNSVGRPKYDEQNRRWADCIICIVEDQADYVPAPKTIFVKMRDYQHLEVPNLIDLTNIEAFFANPANINTILGRDAPVEVPMPHWSNDPHVDSDPEELEDSAAAPAAAPAPEPAAMAIEVESDDECGGGHADDGEVCVYIACPEFGDRVEELAIVIESMDGIGTVYANDPEQMNKADKFVVLLNDGPQGEFWERELDFMRVLAYESDSLLPFVPVIIGISTIMRVMPSFLQQKPVLRIDLSDSHQNLLRDKLLDIYPSFLTLYNDL